jgi:hypothetical protein
MMAGRERGLAGLLIAEAAVLLCALPAVAMPSAWMATIHEWLGMGPMAAGPLVEYLTRSLSLLYGLTAPVLLALAADVRRYLPLIRVLGWVHVVGAGALFTLDVLCGMPLWWVVVEGPIVAGLGVGLLVLSRGVVGEMGREAALSADSI